ncbi:MAG: DNA-primase RepB domain-containing protein [Pyrinomonadaceae bacterium]
MIARGERPEWLRILRQRVARTQEFRQTKLAAVFPQATFSTLDGQTWYGNLLREGILQAPDCVDLFAGMGAKEFAVTMLRDGNTIGRRGELYQRLQTKQLLRSMPGFVKRNRTREESLIVRPIGDHFIQVDECDSELLERLRPFAFLIIETSQQNYQSWLALPLKTEKSDRDSVRTRLLRCLEGVDKTASGAMRWPGSINHKPGRKAFCVRIVGSHPGRFVTPAELDSAGLLAPLLARADIFRTAHTSPETRLSWPDYQRCLREALKGDGSPNRSIADKNWAILALGRGMSPESVEARLREVSEKANRRPNYAQSTVAYALSVVSGDYLPKAFRGMLKQLENQHEYANL